MRSDALAHQECASRFGALFLPKLHHFMKVLKRKAFQLYALECWGYFLIEKRSELYAMVLLASIADEKCARCQEAPMQRRGWCVKLELAV